MGNSEKILIDKEVIEKLSMGLNGLRLMASEKDVRKEIERILKILTDEVEAGKLSFKDLLDEKIKETKYANPELNFNLYMLRRKLEDGKVSQDEAVKAYDLYLSGNLS